MGGPVRNRPRFFKPDRRVEYQAMMNMFAQPDPHSFGVLKMLLDI